MAMDRQELVTDMDTMWYCFRELKYDWLVLTSKFKISW